MPEIGDIWVTIIPKIETYKNKISNVKLERRLCLIIDDGHGFIIEKNSDYLGMKITSQNKKNKKEIRKKYRIYKIQSTEFKRLNKLKCPSEDASVPLGREKKAITSGEGGRDLGGKVDGVGKWRVEGNLMWHWVREKD